MPELPEVETTKSGILPYILNQKIENIIIRNPNLRWPIPAFLPELLKTQQVLNIYRRAKYIIIEFKIGHLICHLGMSGHYKIIQQPTQILKHDHVDILFQNGTILRYHDPRRFGCMLWTAEPISEHFLIKKLGPEPLSSSFNGHYLYQKCNHKNIPIKSLIMNQEIVVGVGNIYASEALFLAKIHPLKPSNTLNKKQTNQLVSSIQQILENAIAQGGTTINDYMNSEGKPGYFNQSLLVYQRENQPCFKCKNPITKVIVNQRSTFFCARCQKN